MRRYHVVRQYLAQVLEHRGDSPLAVATYHVADQLLTVGTLARHHHGIEHVGDIAQARLDLTQFDAKTADLHLIVQTPEVVEHPVRALAYQVTGAVQAPASGAERVGDEALGTQPRAAVIATGKALATDVQLAGQACRQRV
ncbi:hypothetical protein D3C81_845960 [compost metagenome]